MQNNSQRVPKKVWLETPLIESTVLSKMAGCRVFLKLENTQPSGSFKSRGIGNFMVSYVHQNGTDKSNIHFYISSGGNAGLACVTAAVSLNCKASVVVPLSTDQDMISKIREAGGTDIISYGETWFHADQYLRETVMAAAESRGETAIYVPPFDNHLVWEGASTMVDEISSQMEVQPDAIVCSVGGGGLFSGVMLGLDRNGWDEGHPTQVLAVETNGADSLAQSVDKGELVTLPAITSIAKSLGALTVAPNAFKQALRENVSTVVVEDSEACSACLQFADHHRHLVEPACGASLALLYNGTLKNYVNDFGPGSRVVFIVCGGSTVSLEKLDGYRKTYGL
ncbi:uncharacterized protein A1O9_02253 [Exophiala aquamarina CBS 119918]|uniref:L-serine ammonia-lyase n=1 Tax=Exophiala aquamarina CBS 119918 TaxID=1182545 RepID=A0A072PLR3_9EURO|nr:uncharacterized protein A1O9_02253 [Exophiala aquamarina CBS 119918]KEF60692.1 hypothetical protein A1O9_02253 [Exophiala aquamarina CBS 119918]